MLDTAIKKEFHERIVTIDDTNDTAEVNKLPVANEYGYLDNSWLRDYSSYKINEIGEVRSDFVANDQEYINVLTIKNPGIKIELSGNFVIDNVPYTRAIVYRFLIYNPDNYDIEWISNVPNYKIVWNTYSENAPTLDSNGTYIEFISTDRGETWYGIATDMTSYDIVHNYYTKSETDNKFIDADGDTVTGGLLFTLGNTGPYYREDPDTGEVGEIVYNQLQGKMAYNDQWRIGAGATANDRGFLEIATGDNAGINGIQAEPIYISQYQSGGFKKLIRRISLFDNEGNTLFPGNLTVGGPDIVGGKTSSTVTINGDEYITGTLFLQNNRDAHNDSVTPPALIIGNPNEQHLEIDNNEIISKSDAVTPTDLNLNIDSDGLPGGVINIGSGGINSKGPIVAKSISTTEISTAITPNTNDNSNKIATTEFVNNFKDEYISPWLLPEMNEDTQFMCLTNDGTSPKWVTYEKTCYIYRPTTETDTVIVPAQYLTNAAISDVYRDGVLLTKTDDYKITKITNADNSVTTKLELSDTIGTNERIIVVFENARRLYTSEILDNVNLNNSTATTPDLSDNSNRIATTEFVNLLLGNSNPESTSTITIHSPKFTGVPEAPTAETGTNTTQIATTEFVNNAISNAEYASLNSPNFNGTPTAPNAIAGTNTNQIANTAFVTTAINNLIDNAELNTLNQLSSAINNDPNFAATVNSALDNKLNRGTVISDQSGNAITGVTEVDGKLNFVKSLTFSLADHTHNNYTPLVTNTGSGINPIYTDEYGNLTKSTDTVGSGVKPTYLDNGIITESSSTVGSSSKPIYMENGEFKVSNETIGSTDTPVYISNGVITSTDKNFSDYLPTTGGTITGTLTLSNETKPLIIGTPDDQHLEFTSNSINSKNDSTISDLYINENGGSAYFGNDATGKVIISNGVITASTFVGNIGGTSEKASMDADGNVITDTYAPLESPSLTGTPTAPTAVSGDNSNKIATTEYVDTAVSNLINSAPEELNTLKELADALSDSSNAVTAINSTLSTKLDEDSPNYIKNINIDGTTVTVTSGNNTINTYTTVDTTYSAGTGITINSNNEISVNEPLPNQTNNSGKFLTTNGTETSWENIDALPDQANNSGKFLTTNGIVASWESIDALPDQTDNSGKVLTTNGSTASWENIDALPDQANNSGKFLTTDGSVASWETIDAALPDQTGNSGKFLTTNGTEASWTDLLNEIKISSVHYPLATATTITLSEDQTIPSDLNKYSMSIYRDGIYLVSGIDYGFDPSTGVITFTKAFETDEVVSVIFSYLTTDSPEIINYDADKYEAGTGINFVENPITNKVVINAETPLPDQTNNAGKFLSTDGSNASWENIDALPDQTDNAGKFLKTDGTTASWEDIEKTEIKISSLHYPTEGDNTIVLTPGQNLPTDVNKYALAVYRNGIYLNYNVDYSYNSINGILTFEDAFESDEIVTVLFTYLSSDTQPAINLDIPEYEAGNNITFTNNSETNAVTISTTEDVATKDYVNNRFAGPIEKVTDLEISNNSVTIDPCNGSIFNLTVSDNITITLESISNTYYTQNGATITLFIPSHSYIVNWSNNIIWTNGSAPDFSTAYNIITFVTQNGGTTWYGNSIEIQA